MPKILLTLIVILMSIQLICAQSNQDNKAQKDNKLKLYI